MSFQVDNQRILSQQQSRLLLHINPKDKQQQHPLCKIYQLDIGKSLLLKVIQLYTRSHLNKCSRDNLQGLQFFSFQHEDSKMLNHTKCTKLIFQDQVCLRKFQSGMVKQLAVLCLIHRKIPRRSLLELLIQKQLYQRQEHISSIFLMGMACMMTWLSSLSMYLLNKESSQLFPMDNTYPGHMERLLNRLDKDILQGMPQEQDMKFQELGKCFLMDMPSKMRCLWFLDRDCKS